MRPCREPGGPGLGVDPPGESLNIFFGWSRLRFRRHLPRPYTVQHREPAFPIRRVVEVGPEFVQAEMAFRLRAGVALLTMLGKEHAEQIVELLDLLGWRLGPAASRRKRQGNEWNREQDGFHGTDFSGGSRRVGESNALCNNLRPACKALIRRSQLLLKPSGIPFWALVGFDYQLQIVDKPHRARVVPTAERLGGCAERAR